MTLFASIKILQRVSSWWEAKGGVEAVKGWAILKAEKQLERAIRQYRRKHLFSAFKLCWRGYDCPLQWSSLGNSSLYWKWETWRQGKYELRFRDNEHKAPSRVTHPASGIEETDHSINQHLLLTIHIVATRQWGKQLFTTSSSSWDGAGEQQLSRFGGEDIWWHTEKELWDSSNEILNGIDLSSCKL